MLFSPPDIENQQKLEDDLSGTQNRGRKLKGTIMFC